MAIEWIKYDKNLPHKEEVFAIMAMTNLDNDQVCGTLMRLWSWFDNNTENGCAASATYAQLDSHINRTGFCDAVEKAGWLKRANGAASMVNFDYHNGKSAKVRAQAQKRMEVKRNRLPSQGQEISCADVALTAQHSRNQKRKEKNKNPLPPKGKFDPASATIPDNLNTSRFKAAWEQWITYRTEQRKRLTPTSTARQLADLSGWGEPAAVESINLSIRNGWQGLFAPKDATPAGTATTPGFWREDN